MNAYDKPIALMQDKPRTSSVMPKPCFEGSSHTIPLLPSLSAIPPIQFLPGPSPNTNIPKLIFSGGLMPPSPTLLRWLSAKPPLAPAMPAPGPE